MCNVVYKQFVSTKLLRKKIEQDYINAKNQYEQFMAGKGIEKEENEKDA